jgi:hypothetical protein
MRILLHALHLKHLEGNQFLCHCILCLIHDSVCFKIQNSYPYLPFPTSPKRMYLSLIYLQGMSCAGIRSKHALRTTSQSFIMIFYLNKKYLFYF